MHANDVFSFFKNYFWHQHIKTIQNVQTILNFNKKKIKFFKNTVCTTFLNMFSVVMCVPVRLVVGLRWVFFLFISLLFFCQSIMLSSHLFYESNLVIFLLITILFILLFIFFWLFFCFQFFSLIWFNLIFI